MTGLSEFGVPTMNPVPAAPTNWSTIPANWTVTDGNITGIKCDLAAGDIGAWYQCAEQIGRASCRERVS